MDTFSVRTKHIVYEQILEDAPDWLRTLFRDQILSWVYFLLPMVRIYRIFCAFSRTVPEATGEVDSYGEIKNILVSCQWFHFYDLVELMGRELRAKGLQFDIYRTEVNELFDHSQVGWVLNADSLLVRKIPSSIARDIAQVASALGSDFAPAAAHYRKSLNFIYGRPADPENGIKEIVSAVESVGRAMYPSVKTLGDVVKAMRAERIFPPMLLLMIEKFYGYASSEPAVRHGANVTSRVLLADAELCMTIGTGLIQYLLTRKRNDVFLADIAGGSPLPSG